MKSFENEDEDARSASSIGVWNLIENPQWFKRSKEGVCGGSGTGDSLTTAELDCGLDLMFLDFGLVLVLVLDLDLGNGMEEGFRFGSEMEAGIEETLNFGGEVGSRDKGM